MSTTATPSRSRADGRLYGVAALACALIAFAGFAPTYYLKGLFGAPVLPALVHLHGLVMTLWIALFLTQVGLVAKRRVPLHRRFGVAGAILAALVVVVGIATAIEGARRGVSPGPPPLVFLAIPIGVVLVFGMYVGTAVWLRRKSDWHKRLMLLGSIAILTPAIARLPVGLLQAGGILAFFALTDLIAIACAAWDTARNRRLHPAFGLDVPREAPGVLIPDLRAITSGTLAHYEGRAEDFRDGTRDHDVTQNVAALLRHIAAEPPFAILDFGCGPGRDLRTFTALGHQATGLDGAARFVEMARAESGCEVWHQDFLALDLPAERFDGIFANASLFHVPLAEVPRVLRELHATLRPGGALFCSNPRGTNEEGWNRGRYGAYHDLDRWRALVTAAGFLELEHYYRPPGLPREQQPWLATVWRRS